jgi:leader peptidase (prepilin peptidase) / N-methyltransferase
MHLLLEGWPLYLLTVIFGLLIGSFLNVVIYRTPISLDRKWRSECYDYLEIRPSNENTEHYSFVWPGSRCPCCEAPIHAWQNIPVISYLILGGKCSSCKAAISIRYPIFEILTAVLTLLVVIKFGLGWQCLGALIFTWSLIALTGIDLDTQLLPDGICLPLLWLGLIANSFGAYTDIQSALWGAIVGYMSLWIVFWAFKLATGKEGMGFGDFKLMAALGAWVGWQSLPMIILVSSASGVMVAVLMMIFLAQDRRAPIAFGPYLALGGWLAFIYGPEISAAAPMLFPMG